MKTGKLAKVFTFLIFLFIFSFTAYAQQYDPERDFKVSKQEDGKSVVITEYIGSKKEVRIPPTIQGLPVTGISKNVFPPRSSLTSVTFQCAIAGYPNVFGINISPSFPGGLWYKYLAEGLGTYITGNPGENAVWTKQ